MKINFVGAEFNANKNDRFAIARECVGGYTAMLQFCFDDYPESVEVSIRYRHESENGVPENIWNGPDFWIELQTVTPQNVINWINDYCAHKLENLDIDDSDDMGEIYNDFCFNAHQAGTGDIQTQDAGDWLELSDLSITAQLTDSELKKLAQGIDSDAEFDCVLLENTLEFLTELRDEVQDKENSY